MNLATAAEACATKRERQNPSRSLALAKSIPCVFNSLRGANPDSACGVFYLSMWLGRRDRPGPPQIPSKAETRDNVAFQIRSGPPEWREVARSQEPGGQGRSALNALKHGRYATNAIVLKNEDPEAFEELVAVYIRRIQPADPVEYSLTRELAAIDWLLVRVYALDTRLLDHEMEIQAPALDSAGLVVPELTRVLNASRSIVDHSKLPAFLARREAQLVRARHSSSAT